MMIGTLIVLIIIGIPVLKVLFKLLDYIGESNYSSDDRSANNSTRKSSKSGRIVYRGAADRDTTFDYGRNNADGSWEKDGVIVDPDTSIGMKVGNRTHYDDGTSSTRIGDYEFFDDEK